MNIIFDKTLRFFKRRLKKLSNKSNEELICVSLYKGESIFYEISKIAFIENKLIHSGIHSENILDLVDKFLKPDTTFLDIGANIGTITQPIALKWKSSGVEVHSFEASKRICKNLNSNIILNNITNVISYNLAVTNFDGTLTFYEVDEDSDNNGLSSTFDNADIVDAQENEVQAIKIDSISDQFKKPISVIKIDVQGAELNVLKGSLQTIKRDRPMVIFEHEDRYHKNSVEVKKEIIHFFNSLHYKIYRIDSDKQNSFYKENFEGYTETNLIAVPSAPDLS